MCKLTINTTTKQCLYAEEEDEGKVFLFVFSQAYVHIPISVLYFFIQPVQNTNNPQIPINC